MAGIFAMTPDDVWYRSCMAVNMTPNDLNTPPAMSVLTMKPAERKWLYVKENTCS